MTSQYNIPPDNIPKKVGKVDSLVCYEVTDDELAQLEQGAPDSLMLNLAIAFGSVSVSFLVTFFNSKYNSDLSFTIFVCITVITAIAGFVLSLLWWKLRRSSKKLIERIRQRSSK